jgi:hypothetical protein
LTEAKLAPSTINVQLSAIRKLAARSEQLRCFMTLLSCLYPGLNLYWNIGRIITEEIGVWGATEHKTGLGNASTV